MCNENAMRKFWPMSTSVSCRSGPRILFNHQNALYERLVFSEEMHERVSEGFAQILECSLT